MSDNTTTMLLEGEEQYGILRGTTERLVKITNHGPQPIVARGTEDIAMAPGRTAFVEAINFDIDVAGPDDEKTGRLAVTIAIIS